VAKKVAMDESEGEKVVPEEIESYLKARKYFSDVAERTAVPGVATGLAWTPVGGDILFIEASVSHGNGRMILTGQLGDVMKESAQAALSYVKANADRWEIPADAFRYWDLHIHVPAGAIPKDGPSAGVAMLSALISIYTQRKVKHNIAMTGEITLRGMVLPVGGIKEKVLAAKRAGIKQVILPEKNRKDVEEIKKSSLKGLSIHYVSRMDDVVEQVLLKTQVNNPVRYFTIPEKDRHAKGVLPAPVQASA
jgi:ATP-dependent Lon protease